MPSANDVDIRGRDLEEAAEHRADAIGEDVFKVVQQYRPAADADFPRQWYNAYFPCKSGANGEFGVATGQNCDEFPNRAMENSGPDAQYLKVLDSDGGLILDSLRNTSIRPLDADSNQLEGTRYQQFTRRCDKTVQIARLPFLVIPLTGSQAPPSSRVVCPEGSGTLDG